MNSTVKWNDKKQDLIKNKSWFAALHINYIPRNPEIHNSLSCFEILKYFPF